MRYPVAPRVRKENGLYTPLLGLAILTLAPSIQQMRITGMRISEVPKSAGACGLSPSFMDNGPTRKGIDNVLGRFVFDRAQSRKGDF